MQYNKKCENITLETQYNCDLKKYHKISARHVWCVEAQLSYQNKIKFYSLAEKLRKMGNELMTIMQKNYDQLIRTKKYRKLKELYGKCKDELENDRAKLNKLNRSKNIDLSQINDANRRIKELELRLKNLASQMSEMQERYNITWNFCYKRMDYINKKYGVHAHFARSKAEDVWEGVEKCLFGDGEKLHFAKRDELSTIQAKEIVRGITVKNDNGVLKFKIVGSSFGTKNAKNIIFEVKIKDKFDNDENSAIINYLNNAKMINKDAVENYHKGIVVDTYRPCYVSLVCKTIRSRLRVYVHLTIEGKAKTKFKYNKAANKYESRHRYGAGVVANDIGAQSVAFTSKSDIGLYNLAERGRSIEINECQERLIQRAMDRSRRAMNPDNYSENGAVKKGSKTWIKSKRQKKRETEYKELCRINAENRHLAIREMAHYLRSFGDVMITEQKNTRQLQQRVAVINESTGTIERRKHHGRSIKNRCPGYHQEFIKRLFESTGGRYIEVPSSFRASQYDHTNDTYTKRKLSERMLTLSDGTIVQRDWYSSFLMYCADLSDPNHIKIDRAKCLREFPKMYAKYLVMVKFLKDNNIHIINSGI